MKVIGEVKTRKMPVVVVLELMAIVMAGTTPM
jgi:hypothetical protein